MPGYRASAGVDAMPTGVGIEGGWLGATFRRDFYRLYLPGFSKTVPKDGVLRPLEGPRDWIFVRQAASNLLRSLNDRRASTHSVQRSPTLRHYITRSAVTIGALFCCRAGTIICASSMPTGTL